LRRLVLDPLLPALGGVRRLIVALDDVLHAVPLDALPLDGGAVGERFEIELRSALRELAWPGPPPATSLGLVVLGGASYGPLPGDADATSATSAHDPIPTVWERGFQPLPETGPEARGLAQLYASAFGEGAESSILEERQASRERLETLAPRARFLHVATHGWFAPESIASSADQRPIAGQPWRTLSTEEQVRGTSPMLLCGLALAGANLPDGSGRRRGLITAEELASWDLSSCELAVLSACDTNVGIRRAGQGVASLQKALHMAGARSTITSLWKVPDQATRELMLDFYRRIWIEGEPRRRALWAAKMSLRDARNELGQPIHPVQAWAGWVLTGAAD
jgi:CHAT domain-containing protein